MFLINLKNIPNQSFNVSINDNDYHIAVKTIGGLSYMSVWVDNEILFYNQICTPNNWVNPYNYVSTKGKLYFKCLDNEYPIYSNFGNTQKLLFLTPQEVENA